MHTILAPSLQIIRTKIIHAALRTKEDDAGEERPPQHITYGLDKIGALIQDLTRSIEAGYVSRLLDAWPPTNDRSRAEKMARKIVAEEAYTSSIPRLVQQSVGRALQAEKERG